MNKPARFLGSEGDAAFHADSRLGQELLGPSQTSATQLIEWVANWVARGGRNLGKPTHFDARDGKY